MFHPILHRAAQSHEKLCLMCLPFVCGYFILIWSCANLATLQFVKKGGKDYRQDCIDIMETQGVASIMAEEFNKIAPSFAKKIFFIEVSVMETRDNNGRPTFYNTEKLLPDYKKKFTKWCSNAGGPSFPLNTLQCLIGVKKPSQTCFDLLKC